MGCGVCVGFNFDGSFFDERVSLSYDHIQIEVLAGKEHWSHRARARCDDREDHKAVFQTISRFLSELSWKLRIKVKAEICVYTDGLPDCSFPNYFPRLDQHFLQNFVQEVFGDDQHLALGFYREGHGSDSPFYKFLSFYKILELPFKDGKHKGKWVNSLVPRLAESDVSVEYLNRNGVRDIANWIFEEGRNGLSHGYKKPGRKIVDITAFDHWQNIVWANEVVREMAEITLLEKLGIPKRP